MPTTGRLTGRSQPSQPELASDDHALDLARPLADLEHLRVAPVPRDGVLVHEAVATVDLSRLARVRHGDLARVELRDRSLALERLPGEHPRGRVVVGKPRRVRAHLHVGDLELDRLVGADAAA